MAASFGQGFAGIGAAARLGRLQILGRDHVPHPAGLSFQALLRHVSV
jgi:hypothetical protein